MDEGVERIARGVTRGRQFEIEVDGKPVVAFEGETVAFERIPHDTAVER